MNEVYIPLEHLGMTIEIKVVDGKMVFPARLIKDSDDTREDEEATSPD